MIVYKALNGQAPSYIIELLNFKFQTHGHHLRSTTSVASFLVLGGQDPQMYRQK